MDEEHKKALRPFFMRNFKRDQSVMKNPQKPPKKRFALSEDAGTKLIHGYTLNKSAVVNYPQRILCINDLFAGELHFDIYAPLFSVKIRKTP